MIHARTDPLAGARRHGEVLTSAELAGGRQHLEDLMRRRDVDLVDHDDRGLDIELVGDPAVAGPERLRRIEHERRHVDVSVGPFDTVERGGVDPLTECRDRLVQTGGVDEHDLGVGSREHAHDPMTSRLRLVAHDRDLPTADRVDERRLPDVRSTDERDEARPVRRSTLVERVGEAVGLVWRHVAHLPSLPTSPP